MKKHICRIALVLAMLLCCTVGAGAAKTAVDRVQDEKLMSGFTDGKFYADRNVTRAEMAQIVYTLQTDSSDASAYAKLPTSFVDINNHWAAGAVKYCAARGIIRGKSATAFAPDDSVTGLEAAKMVLVGYLDASKDELNGAKWSQNTVSCGNEYGLYSNITGDLAEPITRGDVAQLLCNALDAKK